MISSDHEFQLIITKTSSGFELTVNYDKSIVLLQNMTSSGPELLIQILTPTTDTRNIYVSYHCYTVHSFHTEVNVTKVYVVNIVLVKVKCLCSTEFNLKPA